MVLSKKIGIITLTAILKLFDILFYAFFVYLKLPFDRK
jgi:hypothetical protein